MTSPEGAKRTGRHRYFRAKNYLDFYVQDTVKQHSEESFGAEIFNFISNDYQSRLIHPFKRRILTNEDMILPSKPSNMDELVQKIKVNNTKKELEKHIVNLRLKHNAMLKNEYEEKMMKLREKQIEMEFLGPDEIPD